MLGEPGSAPPGGLLLPPSAEGEEVAGALDAAGGRGRAPGAPGHAGNRSPAAEADHRMLSEALRARAEELRREAEVERTEARASQGKVEEGDPAGVQVHPGDQAEALRRNAEDEGRRRAESDAAAGLARAFAQRAADDARRAAEALDARALATLSPVLSPPAEERERRSATRGEREASEAAAPALDRARVAAQLELVRRADYFAILGVQRSASPDELRNAADRLLDELAPARPQGPHASRSVAGPGDAALAADLEEIRQVVSDAREILCDDALRKAYLGALEG